MGAHRDDSIYRARGGLCHGAHATGMAHPSLAGNRIGVLVGHAGGWPQAAWAVTYTHG